MRRPRYAIYRPRDGAWLCDLLTIRGDDGQPIVVGVTWTTDPDQALRYRGAKGAIHAALQLGPGDALQITNARGRVIHDVVF